MKCRYDTRIPCTEQCRHINTCAWMKNQSRRDKLKRECDRIGEADRRKMAAAAGE